MVRMFEISFCAVWDILENSWPGLGGLTSRHR
jgi:hypothetical protein